MEKGKEFNAKAIRNALKKSLTELTFTIIAQSSFILEVRTPFSILHKTVGIVLGTMTVVEISVDEFMTYDQREITFVFNAVRGNNASLSRNHTETLYAPIILSADTARDVAMSKAYKNIVYIRLR